MDIERGNKQSDFEKPETVTIAEAAKILGDDILPEDVYKRIQRRTLEAYKNDEDEWRVFVVDLKRILEEVEPCSNCSENATKLVIIKYHFHHHVRFELCQNCAYAAQSAYSRKGGVIEIITFPLLGEGWIRMNFYGLSPKE